jgi:uncharacterized protein CbrC (UPF0167 family)
MAKAPIAEIPPFKYHPDPFASGALVESEAACECCGQVRGYLYDGPVYCEGEVERVCPWCIADGSAHAKWDAEFTDAIFTDSQGDEVDVPPAVWEEVLCRTPGVVGACQAVTWWVHCGQPAAFLRVEDDRVRFRCGVCGKRRSYRDLD